MLSRAMHDEFYHVYLRVDYWMLDMAENRLLTILFSCFVQSVDLHPDTVWMQFFFH